MEYESAEQYEKEKKRVKRNKLLLYSGAVIILIALAYFISIYYKPPVPPNYLTVSGAFNATGNGTAINKITFYDQNGLSYPASLPNASGYTVSLPNKNASYRVSAVWQGNYSWQKGTVYSMSPFVLNISSTLQTQKLIFPTPDSVIFVKGTVSTNTGTLANGINYSAPGISGIKALVNFGTYTIALPNMLTYHIVMTFRDVGGVLTNSNNRTCQAGNFSLNISAGSATAKDFRAC